MSSSSAPYEFKTLPGDVKVGVTRMDGDDIVHGAAFGEVLYKVIEAEAELHGALFEGQNFDKVLEAIRGNKIQAYFIIVGWDNCRPQFAGGAVQFPTVLTEWDGQTFKHYPAVYGEDSCVSLELSAEFRTRTKSAEHPNGIGLGTYFMHERINLSVTNDSGDMPFGMVSKGRVAEYASDNQPIKGIYKKLGANLETDPKNTVLEFNGLPRNIKKSPTVSVHTEGLASYSNSDEIKVVIHPNVFITTWSSFDGEQRIVASFTEAISTFTGKPIVRVQFTSNGNLPGGKELKEILATLLAAGRTEVHNRKWISKNRYTQVAPAFPIMRIHAPQEPEIASTLRELGAETRKLGPHSMLPVAINFTNIPNEVLSFKLPSAEPFVTVSSPSEAPTIMPFRKQAEKKVATSGRPTGAEELRI